MARVPRGTMPEDCPAVPGTTARGCQASSGGEFQISTPSGALETDPIEGQGHCPQEPSSGRFKPERLKVDSRSPRWGLGSRHRGARWTFTRTLELPIADDTDKQGRGLGSQQARVVSARPVGSPAFQPRPSMETVGIRVQDIRRLRGEVLSLGPREGARLPFSPFVHRV